MKLSSKGRPIHALKPIWLALLSHEADLAEPYKAIRQAWLSLELGLTFTYLASLSLFLSRPHHTPLADPVLNRNASHNRIKLSKPGTNFSLIEDLATWKISPHQDLATKFGITNYKYRLRHLKKDMSFFTLSIV